MMVGLRLEDAGDAGLCLRVLDDRPSSNPTQPFTISGLVGVVRHPFCQALYHVDAVAQQEMQHPEEEAEPGRSEVAVHRRVRERCLRQSGGDLDFLADPIRLLCLGRSYGRIFKLRGGNGDSLNDSRASSGFLMLKVAAAQPRGQQVLLGAISWHLS